MSASTTLITDANSMITNGPTAATAADAIAAAGPITDYVGMQNLLLQKLKEVKQCLTQLKNCTDSSDPNLTTLNNDLLTLS